MVDPMVEDGVAGAVEGVGLLAVASSFPRTLLGNEYWRDRHPEMVAQAEQKIWMWKRPADFTEGSRNFNLAMEPYLRDPFRGARQRRVLAPGEKVLGLEADAARQALAAAKLDVLDVDLLIASSLLPDQPGIGSAAFLARELGLRGAAWNLESACSSTVLALETAAALVRAGQYRRVLVVTSCAYSRATCEDDPIAWGIGDAATAWLVGAVPAGQGLLGGYSVHSADTNDAVAYHVELDDLGQGRLRMRTGRAAAQLLRDTSERYLHECVFGALQRAGLELWEIDHWVFNTPLAWYSSFCARSLGIDPAKALSVYPLYGNVGPCLPGVTLHHAATWRQYRPGDLVLLYSVGSVSSCAATIVRWGDVALAPLPGGASLELLERLEKESPLVGPALQVA
jgi:3-oxoacyl-[acyl-carrier-protein] synthase-3